MQQRQGHSQRQLPAPPHNHGLVVLLRPAQAQAAGCAAREAALVDQVAALRAELAGLRGER